MAKRKGKACACSSVEFDPRVVGMTVGGLWLRGWDRCAECGECTISKRAVACEAPTWHLEPNRGLSVEIGTGRIRFGRVKVDTQEEQLDVRGLMTRIARLPDLEREVEALRAENETLKATLAARREGAA